MASRASATTLTPPCLTESNDATLMLTNRTSGLLNAVREARGEIAVAGADPDDHVGLGGQRVGGGGAGRPDRADRLRMVVAQRALAGLASADTGMPVCSHERRQRLGGAGVDDAAAGDDQRAAAPTGSPRRRGRSPSARAAGRATCQVRSANSDSGQSCASAWTSCGMRDGGRAGLDGVGEHPHRAEQRRGQLLGPPHPVEVARQRLERVVDGDVAASGSSSSCRTGRSPGWRTCRRAAAARAAG